MKKYGLKIEFANRDYSIFLCKYFMGPSIFDQLFLFFKMLSLNLRNVIMKKFKVLVYRTGQKHFAT